MKVHTELPKVCAQFVFKWIYEKRIGKLGLINSSLGLTEGLKVIHIVYFEFTSPV